MSHLYLKVKLLFSHLLPPPPPPKRQFYCSNAPQLLPCFAQSPHLPNNCFKCRGSKLPLFSQREKLNSLKCKILFQTFSCCLVLLRGPHLPNNCLKCRGSKLPLFSPVSTEMREEEIQIRPTSWFDVVPCMAMQIL